jgi:hypothetical protein
MLSPANIIEDDTAMPVGGGGGDDDNIPISVSVGNGSGRSTNMRTYSRSAADLVACHVQPEASERRATRTRAVVQVLHDVAVLAGALAGLLVLAVLLGSAAAYWLGA